MLWYFFTKVVIKNLSYSFTILPERIRSWRSRKRMIKESIFFHHSKKTLFISRYLHLVPIKTLSILHLELITIQKDELRFWEGWCPAKSSIKYNLNHKRILSIIFQTTFMSFLCKTGLEQVEDLDRWWIVLVTDINHFYFNKENPINTLS